MRRAAGMNGATACVSGRERAATGGRVSAERGCARVSEGLGPSRQRAGGGTSARPTEAPRSRGAPTLPVGVIGPTPPGRMRQSAERAACVTRRPRGPGWGRTWPRQLSAPAPASQIPVCVCARARECKYIFARARVCACARTRLYIYIYCSHIAVRADLARSGTYRRQRVQLVRRRRDEEREDGRARVEHDGDGLRNGNGRSIVPTRADARCGRRRV